MSNGNDSRQRTQRNSTGCVNVPFAQSAPSEIPSVESVAKRPGAADLLGFELWQRAIFLAFQMQSFGRYLA